MLRQATPTDARASHPPIAATGKPRQGLPSSESDTVVTGLNQCLAHLLDLKMRAKRAHWNAKGGSFYSLHKMLDEFSQDLEALSDEVGERVMAVGGVAAGTAFEVSRHSTLLRELPRSTRADDVLGALKADYDTARSEMRRIFGILVEAEDEASMDIVVGAMKLLDKQRSFLRAQLEA